MQAENADNMNELRRYMNIVEGEEDITTEPTADEERLAAVSQLLISKSDEADVESTVSTDAFINMLNNMGVPMSTESLMDLVQSDNSLNNIIKDVSQDTVTFKGKSVEQAAAMTQDKAEDVVSGMAKSQAKKNI